MAKENRKNMPVRWEPLMSDMISFKRSLDQQFENLFSGHSFALRPPFMFKKQLSAWNPEVDMYETNKNVVVEADIPGCDKKDVKIKIDNNMLTISGEKKEEKEIKKKSFYQKEQRMGYFCRSMALPDYADINKPKATYEKGVLKVAFPKTELAHVTHKRIGISGK